MGKTSTILACVGAGLLFGACGDPQFFYTYVFSELSDRIETRDPIPPAKTYVDAHNAAPTVMDMHADSLAAPDEGTYLERLLTNPDRDGHVDVPRLIKGNVALQVFAATSKASLDTLADAVPGLTDPFVDDAGVAHSRYGFERDPNVPEYDDLAAPYARSYADAPYWMPRDVGTYFFRMAGQPCRTWYEDGNWPAETWGPTPPCPDFDPARTYIERLLVMARRLKAADDADARLFMVRSRAELNAFLALRSVNRGIVAALLSSEGIYFRSDASTSAGQARLRATFDELFDAGFRMFSLTHFMDNDHGGSSTGMGNARSEDGRGLSPAGKLFAELSLGRGAVLDVAHASHATVADLAQLARSYQKPLVFSHGGLRDIPGVDGACVNPRNLDAAQIADIASTGGVVGIGYAEEFVCDTAPSAWARAVRHAVDAIDAAQVRLHKNPANPVLRGVDHVGLGSDYDGGIKPYTDVANLNQYTRALMCSQTWYSPNCLDRPFTQAEVNKILGANTLRVLQATLPAN
ncbi:MAG: membrane dipeptidase [Myxococcales bacterium]